MMLIASYPNRPINIYATGIDFQMNRIPPFPAYCFRLQSHNIRNRRRHLLRFVIGSIIVVADFAVGGLCVLTQDNTSFISKSIALIEIRTPFPVLYFIFSIRLLFFHFSFIFSASSQMTHAAVARHIFPFFSIWFLDSSMKHRRNAKG